MKKSKNRTVQKQKVRSDTAYVYASVATVMLPGYTVGTLLGWEYVLTLNTDSNMASIPFGYLAAILGIIIASCIMDKCGRLVSLWSCFWFLYVAVLIRLISSDQVVTCVLRVLGGLSVGAYYQTIPIYISELVYRKHRGVIMAALGCIIAIGIIVSSNSYVKPLLVLVDLVFGLIFLIMKFFYAPETPYYNVAHDHIMRAKRTLQKCRKGDNWRGEIREITLDVAAYPRDATNFLSFMLSSTDLHADFLHRSVTGLGLIFLSESLFINAHLGMHKFLYFNLEDVGLMFLQVIIVLVAFLINFIVIDRWGKKILLLVSSIGVVLFYLILFIIYLHDYEEQSLAITIVDKFLVLCFHIGMDFIPFMYLSEVWPYVIRASAVAFALCLYFVVKCIFPMIYFYTSLYFHPAVPIMMFLLFAIASAFFCWFIPPETKRMSLCAVQIKMDHDVTICEDKLDLS